MSRCSHVNQLLLFGVCHFGQWVIFAGEFSVQVRQSVGNDFLNLSEEIRFHHLSDISSVPKTHLFYCTVRHLGKTANLELRVIEDVARHDVIPGVSPCGHRTEAARVP